MISTFYVVPKVILVESLCTQESVFINYLKIHVSDLTLSVCRCRYILHVMYSAKDTTYNSKLGIYIFVIVRFGLSSLLLFIFR